VHRRLLAAALILLLVVVGSQAVRAQPADSDVVITDAKGFEPALVTINAGETVLWKVDANATAGHSVTSDDSSDEVFDSSPDCDETPGNDNCLKPGDFFDHTFATPGTYTYHDRADPTNQGEVIVLRVATTTSAPPPTTTIPPETTTAPTTTAAVPETTTAPSTTTSTASPTTTTLVTVTTNDSSDVGVKDGDGGGSNAPLLAGAAIVVAGLAGAAWWAYNRGGPPMGPGPYDNLPPTTMGPEI
jgi:plastocyanin